MDYSLIKYEIQRKWYNHVQIFELCLGCTKDREFLYIRVATYAQGACSDGNFCPNYSNPQYRT